MSSGGPVARNATHARVLDTAWQLVTAEGIDVSMERIAEASGISRQALYLYVDTRAGLFVQMARHRDERSDVASRFQRAHGQPTPVGALEASIATWFDYVAEILPVARALMRAAATDAHAAAAWWDRMDASVRSISVVVERLDAADLLDPAWDPAVAGQMLWGLIHIRLYDDFVHHHGWTHHDVIDRQTRAAKRTLLREGREQWAAAGSNAPA